MLKLVTRNINVLMVGKVFRRDISPRIMFVSLSKGIQEPDDRVFKKVNNPYYIILQNLELISGYSSVGNEIYWNYYNTEVEGLLLHSMSTTVCQI